MNKPTENIEMKSLGKLSKFSTKAVASITMLGSNEKLKWKQTENCLMINKPVKLPEFNVIVFKINFKKQDDYYRKIQF